MDTDTIRSHSIVRAPPSPANLGRGGSGDVLRRSTGDLVDPAGGPRPEEWDKESLYHTISR